MEHILNNLVNGNLTDARREAKWHDKGDLIIYAVERMFWSWHLARAAAEYLKAPEKVKGAMYQRWCDALEFTKKTIG